MANGRRSSVDKSLSINCTIQFTAVTDSKILQQQCNTEYIYSVTSGNGGIFSHAYKLAFLTFFPAAVLLNCIASGLRTSSEDVDGPGFLPADDMSC